MINIFTKIKEALTSLTSTRGTKIIQAHVREESKDLLESASYLRNEFSRLIASKYYLNLKAVIQQSPYYVLYMKFLPSSLVNMEKRQPLSSFVFILEKVYTELQYLETYVKDNAELFDEVSLENMNMTKMTVFCVVSYFENLIEYIKTFLVLATLITMDNVGKKENKYLDPLGREFPWMKKIINENTQPILNSLDAIIFTKNDKIGVLLNNLLIKIKKVGYDPALLVEGKINSFFLDTVNNYDLEVKNFFFYGARWLNFYRHFQNIKTNYRHSKYLKRKHEKALLENYMNLIKLKTMDTDENDPEYKKMTTIIGNYTDMINDLQKEIISYETT